EGGQLKSTVFSCSEAMCTWMRVHGGTGAPKVRLRPDFARSNVAYAFTDHHLYRSSDVWGFSRIETPWPAESRFRDLALVGSGDTLFAAVHAIADAEEGLYRSDDGGATWSRVRSPLFRQGAASISIADGRMLVSLPDKGLACSSDGGRRWSRRCA
ncbi:MAG TPA: hypothetical protein VEU29_01815, partial [Actinomycetota bacterium]|nr:hypothetical protein [Actinomycetota bacterium]